MGVHKKDLRIWCCCIWRGVEGSWATINFRFSSYTRCIRCLCQNRWKQSLVLGAQVICEIHSFLSLSWGRIKGDLVHQGITTVLIHSQCVTELCYYILKNSTSTKHISIIMVRRHKEEEITSASNALKNTSKEKGILKKFQDLPSWVVFTWMLLFGTCQDIPHHRKYSYFTLSILSPRNRQVS